MISKNELLTSKMQPDEFGRGYRGRLKTLNSFRQSKKFMEALSANLLPQGVDSERYSDVEILALAAGQPIDIFLESHSLLPFFQMVPTYEKSANHGDSAQFDITAWYGIKTWEQIGARFCLECVSEETEAKGYAYWHRSHQLPGICWCSKHGTQLAKSPLNTAAFDGMPTSDMEAQYEFSEADFSDISSNKVIQRYADIVFSVLNSKKPLSSIHAIYRMGELLKVDQIRVGMNGQRPTLTDRLLNQMPLVWLQSHYPTINNRAQGEYFHSIDSLAARPVANNVYVLGLASLFESSDEAINYWFSSTDDLPNTRKMNRRYEVGYWNSDEIYRLYVKLLGNHSRIAEALGVYRTFAGKELTAAGLPSLQDPDMASIGGAIAAIQLGMSVEVACESNGVSQTDVEKLLKGDIERFLRAIKENHSTTPEKDAAHLEDGGRGATKSNSTYAQRKTAEEVENA